TLTPEDFGVEPSPPGAASGGDAKENADAMLSVLKGEPHPGRKAFLINAAAAFCIVKAVPTQEAYKLAEELVDSGKALKKLESWIQQSQDLAKRYQSTELSK
ncbi:MAG: hypothetical protein MK135_17615, partial [Polyangiaceae bacterium]|nr:hypothetical protein [Polyangiaceae bacterium]